MVQRNILQQHFPSFRGKSVFFFNQIKDMFFIKTLPALSKRDIQDSQWFYELQWQPAGRYGRAGGKCFSSVKPLIPFLWRLHCIFDFAQVFIGKFLLLPFFVGCISLLCAWHYCIMQKRHTPAGNTPPQLILGWCLGQRLFGSVIILF